MDMGQYVEDDELYYEYGADEEYDPYYDPDDPYYDPDDPYAYYGENGEQHEEYEYVAISFHELCTSCIWPSFTQTLWMVFPLLILCLVQRLTWSLFWQGTSERKIDTTVISSIRSNFFPKRLRFISTLPQNLQNTPT